MKHTINPITKFILTVIAWMFISYVMIPFLFIAWLCFLIWHFERPDEPLNEAIERHAEMFLIEIGLKKPEKPF